MNQLTDVRPAHRQVWGGLSSDDRAAEVGLLGVPFDSATSYRWSRASARLPVRALDIVEAAQPLDQAGVTSRAAVTVIYEVLGWVEGEA